MSKGKKTDEKIKAKAMAKLMMGNKVSFVAKELGLADSTVRTWEKQLENYDEFVKVRDKIITDRLNEYLMTALECEGTALEIVKRKLDTAVKTEDNRDLLIERIIEMDQGESFDTIKRDLRVVMPEALSDVVRCFGVMAEKVALMSGRATQNVNLSGSVGMKFEDF